MSASETKSFRELTKERPRRLADELRQVARSPFDTRVPAIEKMLRAAQIEFDEDDQVRLFVAFDKDAFPKEMFDGEEGTHFFYLEHWAVEEQGFQELVAGTEDDGRAGVAFFLDPLRARP